MTRLTSRFLIDLLLRETQAAGGFAAILAAGDDRAGTILVQCSDRGQVGPLLERRFSFDGGQLWEAVGPGPDADDESRANYHDRRRRADPDLWIVELDIADAPRLVAEWGAIT
ncbi:MAG: DUF1491 family protein [Sphingopyxis sp.]|uniref:DUF1491 family protein n=1 Tax=Sphingopyxis sp. TaxID=1908224 RepID=UPI002ABC8EA8|nr:DUF1491 family protein [Sphingopyxis sp.]MDZ3832037.1 DUF1491 family protein [Sphingopyxis sp.]